GLRLPRAPSTSAPVGGTQNLPGWQVVGAGAPRPADLIAAMPDARDVVIIGGGFAGLSAGVALAERGFKVAVLERKPALGGRAYSFADPDSGDFVDNG